jgi:hypothetical protein
MSTTPRLTVPVKGLKVTTLLSPQSLLTPGLVAPEPQPAGEVPIALDVAGKLTVACMLNGKSVRKALKVIAEHGPENVNVLLQGNLICGAEPGSFVLDCPGLTAQPKASKPEPTSPPPGGPASP